MANLHIYAPRSYYIGQLRRSGCRNWETVTSKRKSAESAMASAVKKMRGYKRARVLLCDYEGWLGCTVVMETKR